MTTQPTAPGHEHTGHSDAHPHAGPSLSIYYTVFGCLLALTFATVAVSWLHLNTITAIVLAFLIAISKASLVAAFFMHLKYEGKALHVVCLVPTILTLLLLFALMPDVGLRSPGQAGAPGAHVTHPLEQEEEAADEGAVEH